VSAPIVRDAAVSLGGQKEHLILERVGVERPAMTEDYGLTRAPVLVVDLGAVLGSDHARRPDRPRTCGRRTLVARFGIGAKRGEGNPGGRRNARGSFDEIAPRSIDP